MSIIPGVKTVLLALLLTLATSMLFGCSHVPHPKSPEQVARESTDEPPDATAIAVLDALELDAEQRTRVVALRDRLKQELAATEAPRQAFIDALLAELRAGKVDRARMAAPTAALVQAIESARPAILDGLDELHAILRPDQRRALIDGIAARREEQQGDAEEQMKRMNEQLDLGFSQKLRIGAALRDRLSDRKEEGKQLKEDREAAAAAFREERFDARHLAVVEHLDLARWFDSFLIFAEVVVSELEPVQHATLAAILEQRMRRDDG